MRLDYNLGRDQLVIQSWVLVLIIFLRMAALSISIRPAAEHGAQEIQHSYDEYQREQATAAQS